MKKKLLVTLATAVALGASPAFAAIDTAGAVGEISGISEAVVAVGGALIGCAATAVSVKWVKAAIFG
ncbi:MULTISPECIES: major capsid protein [unclassified Salinivibrio]|uniref:major capsid protein n=1 Tax=unclassified Salinivibrio TaxID=2636825 RepID=UPI00098793DE|nr:MULTISPECIES: major capsid protein [unclassified Salinivibrio]OOF11106.1 hypothetical protein BZG82_05690 [Salinivibrio sp. PR5]OOF20289.1 hypothetical protein BZJ18_17075 [Salinivibrio sp. IB872]OOF20373.1 hypothetical protein BZJ18_17040 [Salinivibrio sp. IB872]